MSSWISTVCPDATGSVVADATPLVPVVPVPIVVQVEPLLVDSLNV